MTSPQFTKFTRRDFLKLSGTLATASLLAACQPDQETSVVNLPATESNIPVANETPTPLPAVPLAIMALSRMSFGARPGDIESFLALGGNDDGRLHAYVQQQLNQDSIDDSDFESRYTAAGFETLHKSHEQLYADHIASNPYDSNNDTYWEWICAMTSRAFSPPDNTRHRFSTSSPEKPKQPASERSEPWPACGNESSSDWNTVRSPSSRSIACCAK